MKFSLQRQQLLKPLSLSTGVVERRQTLPVLSNLLVALENNKLLLTGSDLEVEITMELPVTDDKSIDGEITIPARKLMDIVKSLPEESDITVTEDNQRILVKCGRSRFTLSTLPASEFPNIEDEDGLLEFSVDAAALKYMIDATSFAMAHQDVRYYLNGILIEVSNEHLRVVATDGHRLAMCTRSDLGVNNIENVQHCIVPRKGVMELVRLLADLEGSINLKIGTNHLWASAEQFTFVTKLVDGRFPDYERVLPEAGSNIMLGERQSLKDALSRAAILSNEKYRGVRLGFGTGQLTIQANNPEQEEAIEEVSVDYDGDEMEIGFNVSYLQDVINVLKGEKVQVSLTNGDSSALLGEPQQENSDQATETIYVVMPMRL